MLERGRVVLSLAGHDKDSFYLLVRVQEDGFCWVSDGKRRPLSHPKKKNPRHLRATRVMMIPEEIASDRALRRRLAAFGPGDAEQTSTREENCEYV